jgi:hypothetical protein
MLDTPYHLRNQFNRHGRYSRHTLYENWSVSASLWFRVLGFAVSWDGPNVEAGKLRKVFLKYCFFSMSRM